MKNKGSLEQRTERIVLVVDDQYGRADFPIIEERYGNGQIQGYRFVLETAENGEIYDVQKVISRINGLNPDIVLLDLDFGFNQKGYGLDIMREIKRNCHSLPVLMHSGSDRQKDREVLERCVLEFGAKAIIPKLPQATQLKSILDRYVECEHE